jgi:hypothetical protein
VDGERSSPSSDEHPKHLSSAAFTADMQQPREAGERALCRVIRSLQASLAQGRILPFGHSTLAIKRSQGGIQRGHVSGSGIETDGAGVAASKHASWHGAFVATVAAS